MGALKRATAVEIEQSWGDEEEFERALDRIAAGVSLWEMCQERVWSFRAAMEWIEADPGRLAAYEKAERLWTISQAHMGLALVDGATPEDISVRKERFAGRKWMAAKFNPARFGEKMEVQHGLVPVLVIEVGGGAAQRPVIDVTPAARTPAEILPSEFAVAEEGEV